MLVAQVSDGKLQLGGLLDRYKVNVDEYKEIIESFKQLDVNSRKFTDRKTGKTKWDKVAESIKGCDEASLSYFKTLDNGNGTINNQSASVEGLGAHLKATGQSFNFTAIKATLLNAALNAGIMLLASFVVNGIIKGLDAINLTVEEQTEKVENLKLSYKGLQSEYDALSQKQDLTATEKRRLEYLERRLELDGRILKAEEHQLFEEKTGNKFTDWFDKDNYNVQYTEETSINKLNTNPDNYAFLSRLYDKKMNDIAATEEQIREWKKYRDSVAEGSDAWNVYQSHIDDAQNRQTASMKDLENSADKMTVNLGKYADNIEYFEERLASGDLNEEDTAVAEKQLNNWRGLYESTEKMLTEIQKLDGTYNDIEDRMAQSIRSVYDDHGLVDREAYLNDEFGYEKILEYTNKLTPEQKELWITATDGIHDAQKAIEAYEAELAGIHGLPNEPSTLLSIPDTITHLNTNLKPAFDSLHAAYQNIFTDDGALDRSSIDILSTCDSIKSKLDEMSELGLKVDYSSFENFVRVLNNTESTEQDVEKAMNSLATSIAHAALSGAEDFDTMRAALENMDVSNSAMVAFDEFTNNAELLDEAVKQAGLTMDDFAMSTDDGKRQVSDAAMAFLKEMVGAENCAQALALLQLKQFLLNQSTITTADDCQNILNLATAANIGIIKLQQLQTLMDMITRRDSAVASGDSRAVSELNRAIHEYSANTVNSLKTDDLEVDFATIGGGTSAAGSAGRSAGRSYRDALKEELGDLNSIISGVTRSIDDQISSVNEQKSTALDALDAEKNALEETKDAAVEALEAERDARLEVIEAQKEQLEEQVSLIDRQIEQKQKEIDAINDAADARQREIDLQKAQYELERMQNQHTILQYSEAEGMHYVQDTSGIRDAKEQADEAKRQIEIAGIEKEIDLLENEKDLIHEQIDLLDEQTELINTFYDAEIEKVEKFYDDQIRAIETRRTATESHFESVIRNLEDSKAKYEELTSVVDKAELSAKLKQLGIDEEALLSGSEEEFRKLKDTYMGIVSQLNEGNDAVMTSLQSLSGFTDTASKTTAIASDVGTIADGLNQIPDSQTITDLSRAFGALAESINKVAAALGLSQEAEIGTLAQAILNLNNIPLDDASKGIIAQFTNLKTAIDSVTSAINGDGGESSDNEGQGGSPGKGGETRGKDSKGGGGGSLADAITSMGETAAEVIGEADAEGDGTVIGEFGSLKTAVDNVTSSVGTGESEDGNNKGGDKTKAGGKSRSKDEDSGGLTGSIVNLGKTTVETLGEPGGDGIIGRFEQFKEPISEAAGHVQSISDGLDAIDGKEVECTITVNVNQTGGADIGGATLGKMNLDSTSHSAKFGKSNTNGTNKNKGLPKAERNALISEYGQTELTVFPNGNTVFTNKPTIMDLPKGTIVFNEDQTKQLMRDKIHVGDTAHTNSTTSNIQPAASGEIKIMPLHPSDQIYDYMQKWNAYFGSTDNQTAALMPGSMFERGQQLYNAVNQITTNNISGKNQPNIHVGDIHITCPGVTSKEVAKQVGVELNHMFSGLHLDAEQQSRMR